MAASELESTERWQLAAQTYQKLRGPESAGNIRTALTGTGLGSEYLRYGLQMCFGDVWSRPVLDLKARSIATLTILTMMQTEAEIRLHMRIGLRNGLTPEEIDELIIQWVPYMGSILPKMPLRILQELTAGPAELSLQGLPEAVLDVMKSASVAQYATLSASGVPIDTPTFCYADTKLASIDIATGLAYPAKAERARRNPQVGLLLEGGPGEPVISIAGHAVVKDADIQANVDRVIAETANYLSTTSAGSRPWEVLREAVWYWARIFVRVVPDRIMWWDNPGALDGPPHVWEAPSGTACPQSDPAPESPPSRAPQWPVRDWRVVAAEMVESSLPAHLTLCDDRGFPLPFPVHAVHLAGDGFELDVAQGAPWRHGGKATLTYIGLATFVGVVTGGDGKWHMKVERTLPVLPITNSPDEIWEPQEETRMALMERLAQELKRRGLDLPIVPEHLPEPTVWSLHRGMKRRAMAARLGS